MNQQSEDIVGGGRRWRLNWSAMAWYAICILAVSWLIYNTDWTRLKEVWVQADKSLILLGILVFGPAPVLISLRLKWLLAIHKVDLTFWQAVKVTFAGNFIIWTLPVGTPGGDSLKAYYVARETPHKHEAVTTVFFDRVIGVLSLVLMSGVVVLLNWDNPAFARWGRIIGMLVVGLLLGGGIYYSNRLRRLFRLDQLVSRMPFSNHLRRIDQAVFSFRHRILTIVACLVLSLVLQGMVIVSVFLCGWALGIIGDEPIWDFLIYLGYTPICLLAGVMPLGIMEETFKQLLVDETGFGTREAAYSLSLLNRVVQLLWSLPGALVVFKGGYRPKTEEFLEEKDPKLGIPP